MTRAFAVKEASNMDSRMESGVQRAGFSGGARDSARVERRAVGATRRGACGRRIPELSVTRRGEGSDAAQQRPYRGNAADRGERSRNVLERVSLRRS
jgi:hypothetical protein